MSMKNKIQHLKNKAFSLVEVTIAMGLVSFVMVALLGLFSVGITTSREAGVETVIAQIVMQAQSQYDGETGTKTLMYNYEGELLPTEEENGFFEVKMESKASTPETIEYTSSNLHLLRFQISSPRDSTVEKVVHSTVFVP